MASNRYNDIDIHKDQAAAWPACIPPMTDEEAVRAVKRLWRYAMGEALESPIKIATGNRNNWYRNGVMYVNPSQGWREFVHDLSHLFVWRANRGTLKPHSKFHERFETKLVREVIRRGWLDGKLRDEPKPGPVSPTPTADAKRQAELAKIDAALERWNVKLARAQLFIRKYERRRRYYARVLGVD